MNLIQSYPKLSITHFLLFKLIHVLTSTNLDCSVPDRRFIHFAPWAFEIRGEGLTQFVKTYLLTFFILGYYQEFLIYFILKIPQTNFISFSFNFNLWVGGSLLPSFLIGCETKNPWVETISPVITSSSPWVDLVS